ncbi:MAG: MG2 domain-containing protein [Bacteroidetes bacterium]|nr:MG2 domain-containing protein [Bacteroidota bacterium]
MSPRKKLLIFVGIPALVILLALILIQTLGKPSKGPLIHVNPAFRQYVQAFTSGFISSHSTIKVRLNDDYVDSSSMNIPLKEDLLKVKPSIKGTACWIDSRTIEFRPEEPLPQDKIFTVQFFLSKLLTVPDSMKTMAFQFQTIRQDFDVSIDNHKAVSESDLTKEILQGTVFTADVADDKQVELMLTANQDGNGLPVTWQHDSKNNKHFFQLESIMRGDQASSVKLNWNGNPIGSSTDKQFTEEIPALGDFRWLELRNIAAGDPYYVLRFTDPLKHDQNLDGLVRVGKFSNLRVSIQDNELIVYPPANMEGNPLLTIEPYLRNCQGKELGQRIVEKLSPEGNMPNARFVGTGVIMPSSNGMLLPFEAVNLKAIDVKVIRIYENNIFQFLQINEMGTAYDMSRVGRTVLKKTIPLNGAADYGRWNRFSIDLSTLMKTEPGAIYSVNLSFMKQYSTYPCASGETGKPQDMVVIQNPDRENDREGWNYYNNYDEEEGDNGGWENYRWNERGDPCKASYYFNKTATRNVFASNLGMIAKGDAENEFTVFVTDLVSSKPLSGVKVDFFNYQQQIIGIASTNGDGMAMARLNSKPFIAVAVKDKEKAYLKLTEGNSLSLSMFDVSGEPVQKGIKGFIYGERGVWRPGDSIYLTFILEDKSGKLPATHPVNLALFNPSGQMVSRSVLTSSVNGFYAFRTVTPPSAPTGNWLAKVKVGGVEFQKTLKIETVKPNRLKIRMDFNKAYLQKNKIPPVRLEASWLTGATAHGLKAEVNLTLTKAVTAFKQFPAYTFDNPTAGFAAENISIFEGKLNDEGKTTITPVIHVTNVAPGVLNASFETKVFEDGGDFSIDRFTIPYYPYVSFAGLRIPLPSARERVLYTDKPYDIDLVNIDPDGNLVPSNRLKVEVFKLEWRWWWDDSERNSADFVSTSHLRPVDSATVRTASGKGSYKFRVDYDEWGRYLIKVTDRSSGHIAGKVVYVDWPGYFRMPGGEKQAASMLTLTTDKSKYTVGETVKLSLPTSPDGRALLTVENGSRVLKSFWTPTSKGSTDISFKITEDMAPNCYAFMTLIQPHAQSKNDLPIRLYGVVPVFVENPETHLKPVISLKGKLVPMQSASITVKEAKGRPMSYTLAVVDEGLLDLTRFKTPDAWTVFYAREALGIKTWDLFDQVMGAFSGDLQRILSIGGDQDLLRRSSLKANRFKAMVKFFGPFELKKGESRTTTFTMPEYIGSVRVMVVAGYKGAYGSEEQTAAVKKPLMVQGTLPRVLGPGENVKLPVSVFAMEKTVKNVKVSIEVNTLFQVSGGNTRDLSFSDIGDQLVNFDLKVGDMTGIAKVKIIAVSGNERAENTIEIDIRNPNLPVTDVYEKTIPALGNWNTAFTVRGLAGTNSGTIELTSMPPLNLEKWMSFLIHYPYGCIEQTTSSVFPQLYLKDLVELSSETKARTEQNIKAGIQMIRSFQMANGGLTYWPGSGYADDWGSCYAGHFMLEAEKKGFVLPPNFLAAWKVFQREKAISWTWNANWNNNELLQAYRLYTLALARSPELGAMNKLLERKDLSLTAKWRLAGAYLLAGKPEVAQQLTNGIGITVSPYIELANTYGSDLRDKAMILEVLGLMNMKTKAAPLARDIAAELCKSGWLSTQTSAYCLIALSGFYGANAGSGINASFSLDQGEKADVNTTKSISVNSIDPKPGRKQNLKVINNGKNVLYARLLIRGIPAYGDSSSANNNLKISVSWSGLKGEAINVSKLAQGESFIAEVKVTNPGLRGAYKNLALAQVFPSGWEIMNFRMSEMALAATKASELTYQDVRDDRVLTYFDLAAGESKTFKCMLMATYQGRFYLPPVLCEAMYDGTINARVAGRWVVVGN